MKPLYAGTVVRFTASFTNETTGQPADPTTVTFEYRVGGATAITWTYGQGGSPIVKDSTGHYHADINTTALPGTWIYAWAGTGPASIQVYNERSLVVLAPTL